MTKPIINFGHSNGFPKESYAHLFNFLSDDFEIVGKEMLAHDERFQVQRNWNPIADEIIDYLDENRLKKVIGLGHSLGATSAFIAAQKRPDLFSAIILLDPVLVVGFWPEVITEFLKRTGYIAKLTPAAISKNRKRQWKSKEEALAYFRTKKFFESFTEKSLKSYVNSGLIENDEGFALKFQVENEVKLFKTPHNHLSRFNKSPLKVPGAIIYGAESNVSRITFIEKLCKIHGMQYSECRGSHMFPLEFPEQSAQKIKFYLDEFNKNL